MMLPRRRDGWLSSWTNACRDYLQSIIIHESADITPEYTPMGVVLRLTRNKIKGPATESAWQQITNADGTGLNVSAGPLVWEPGLVDTAWADYTNFGGGTPYSVSFPGTTEARWLYVQADLSTSAVTVAFMTSTAFPAHDITGGNAIYRFPLSLWQCAAGGTGYKVFDYPEMPRIPGWARPRGT